MEKNWKKRPELLFQPLRAQYRQHATQIVAEHHQIDLRQDRFPAIPPPTYSSCVVNPADIHRRGKERYTKTDRIDAQLISRKLRDGRLCPIHVPGRKREELRALFRRRNEAVKALRRIKSSIKMQILFFGEAVPPEFDNEHWSHAFRRRLRKQEFFYGSAAEALRSRLRSLDFSDSEVRPYHKTKRVIRFNEQHSGITHL